MKSESYVMRKNSLTIFAIAFSMFAAISLSALEFSIADEPPASSKTVNVSVREELKPLNSLIGNWRGVGQPKRGSRQGAWKEQTSIAWDFSKGQSAVLLTNEGGKQFEQLRFTWDDTKKLVSLEQTSNETVLKYSGPMPKTWPAKLVLVTDQQKDDATFRCTIEQLKDIRATILLEKRTSATGSFRRIAQIGYTLSGSRLAVAGGGQRKCVVTGGLGTIPVTHEGKTYYVCCQGCVQAFNASPKAIIAEYKASLRKATSK